MPLLSLERRYSVEYRVGSFSERSSWTQSQLDEARREILEESRAAMTDADCTIDFDVGSRRLVVAVRSTERIVEFSQATPGLYGVATRHLEEQLARFGEVIAEVATRLSKSVVGEAPAYTVYFSAGLHLPYGADKEHIFKSGAVSLESIEVSVPLPSVIGEAVRDPNRLAKLVRSAVINRNVVRGVRTPDPLRCSVELASANVLLVRGEPAAVDSVVRSVLGPNADGGLRPRVVDSWPRSSAPYWATASLALALFAVLGAWLPVRAGSLAFLGLGAAAIIAVAIRQARADGASVGRTALGIAPAFVVVAFAVVYGVLALGSAPSVSVESETSHLVDVLLLSLGVATTGGFLDVSLDGRGTRIVALVEMLLMVSVAGGSLYVATRALVERIAQMSRERLEEIG